MNKQNPSDNLPDGLKPVIHSFAALEEIKDPIYREYELLQYAKRYDLPIDSFRQMFNDYCRQQQEAKWKQSPVTAFIWRKELRSELLDSGDTESKDITPPQDENSLDILSSILRHGFEVTNNLDDKQAEPIGKAIPRVSAFMQLRSSILSDTQTLCE
jgi:hypothetical protein